MSRFALALLLILPVRAARTGEADPLGTEAEDPATFELRRAVEAALNRCIGPGQSWGHYEGQFRDVLALGPGVPRLLLRLFTTPHAIYAFAHDFADTPGEDAVEREHRILILQRLAGDALGETRDRSVIPDLAAFLDRLEKAMPNPADAGGVQQDLHATAAIALLKLGEPLHFERLVRTLRREAAVTIGDGGAVKVVPAPDRERRFRQMALLERLAMLHARDDNVGMAERVYQQVLDLGAAELQRLRRTPEAHGDWMRLFGVLQGTHYNLACVYARRVKTAESIRSLRQAVDYGYIDLAWIRRDRDLDPIREDPGFAELVTFLETRLRNLRDAARREREEKTKPGKNANPAPPPGLAPAEPGTPETR